MMLLPPETPVNTPVFVLIVAMFVLPLLQVPFGVALTSIIAHVAIALASISIGVRRAHQRGFGSS